MHSGAPDDAQPAKKHLLYPRDTARTGWIGATSRRNFGRPGNFHVMARSKRWFPTIVENLMRWWSATIMQEK